MVRYSEERVWISRRGPFLLNAERAVEWTPLLPCFGLGLVAAPWHEDATHDGSGAPWQDHAQTGEAELQGDLSHGSSV